MQNPVITIEMMNGDVIKAELYPEIAPNTVNNFLSLVKNGFYDGLIFHRVIRGFMIQGGCPNGNGMGGPGYSIKGEFSSNGFPNTLAHTEDVYKRQIYTWAEYGTPSGYATIVVLLSFMFAMLFIIVGIIGEYIAILFAELKDRPVYIVEDMENFPSGTEHEKKMDGDDARNS